jgi:hypothetical protein
LNLKILQHLGVYVAENFTLNNMTDSNKLTIKIEDEEFISFKIKSPFEIPQEPNEYEEAFKVMVDLAEPCSDWQTYKDGAIYDIAPLPKFDILAENVKLAYHMLFNYDFEEFVTERKEYDTGKAFFDNRIINSFDFCFVAGHGERRRIGRLKKDLDGDIILEKITIPKYKYGDNDIEFLVFEGCSVLSNADDIENQQIAKNIRKFEKPKVEESLPKKLPSDWRPSVKGVHAILGNANEKGVLTDSISDFIRLLSIGKYTVKAAWQFHFEKNYGWIFPVLRDQKIRIIYPKGYEKEKYWKNNNKDLPIECMPDPADDTEYLYIDFYWEK